MIFVKGQYLKKSSPHLEGGAKKQPIIISANAVANQKRWKRKKEVDEDPMLKVSKQSIKIVRKYVLIVTKDFKVLQVSTHIYRWGFENAYILEFIYIKWCNLKALRQGPCDPAEIIIYERQFQLSQKKKNNYCTG